MQRKKKRVRGKRRRSNTQNKEKTILEIMLYYIKNNIIFNLLCYSEYLQITIHCSNKDIIANIKLLCLSKNKKKKME
jgi:hypothetical protein